MRQEEEIMRTQNDIRILSKIFSDYGYIMTTAQLTNEKLFYRDIQRMLEQGLIERLKRGCYHWVEDYGTSEVVIVNSLFPDAVLCMETALFYYRYSDRTPVEWNLTIDKNTSRKRTNIDYPFIKAYRVEPGWWDYNLLLIESIGKIGAEALGRSANLLDMNMVLKHFPVVSVSDFFVNRIAGNSYFPLLEMLDGAEPNEHHLTLAKLAKEKHIAGIVTTNFDTLIEKAFDQMHVPYTLYSVDEDYQKQDSFTGIPICKIHGSAEKAILSIDTVQQKLQGLSVEKKYMLRKLFSENHILFIGFSGEDFLFGSDYIPVKVNKTNDYGITWFNIAMCDFKHWNIEKELKFTEKNSCISIMKSATKAAKRSGSAQGIFETNSYLAVMYAAFGQKKLFEQALKKAEDVKELCVGKTENSTFLQFLKEKTQYFQEDLPWPEDYIGVCRLHDYSNEWKPFGDRPILKFKEGKYAKKLFDSGKKYESVKYLEDKMRYFIDSNMLEEADAFSNCLAGIFLERANKLRIDNLIEESVKTRNNCKIFYEQCLELECKLGRFDYLPSTLGELSMLNSYEDSLDMLERGLFQAELCLCFCDNPLECWQIVLAAEAACIINMKMNKRVTAMEYCEKYFEIIHKAPWVVYTENIVEMKKIYDDLVRST